MQSAALIVIAATLLTGEGRAIDGDTLFVGHTRVRLRSLLAGELGTVEGERAKAVMAALINGRVVTCKVHAWQKAKPPYPPRAVASCSVDGRDLGEAMIEAGGARR